MKLALILILVPLNLFAASTTEDRADIQRAKRLKEFLAKEKPRFEERETQRKGIMGELDRLNVGQNAVRQRLHSISAHQQELSMALGNLSMEVDKQKEQEALQKKRLMGLMKIVYRVKQDGVFRFLINGQDLGSLASRVRILYHTLKTHSVLTRQLEERAKRLTEGEKKLASAQTDVQSLMNELKEQEELLDGLLQKKHFILKNLNQKQTSFQVATKEYRQVSSQLAKLFDDFEAVRENSDIIMPNRGSLPLPLELGRIVKNFGRSVHEKFHTVTYQKGIEIEADHNSPVTAILPGVVEYEGWVKGLGNILIVHHGGGFYSLSAHLFKTLKPQGSKVQQGETIGLVGDTGNSEKPSLYFEIRENGKAVDPLMYFSPRALASLH